jgi:protein gp37
MTTKIQWTEKTWNPLTGCDKVSAGCKFCYAETMSKRLKAIGLKKYRYGFELTLHWLTVNDPFSWKKPMMVFVNSMSDLFHKDVPLNYIQLIFKVMNATPQHTYQILTKRADRLLELAPHLDWTANIWMGVSVENQEQANIRIPYLLQVPAAVRFLSMEPLLDMVWLDNIDALSGGHEKFGWINCLNGNHGTIDEDYPDVNKIHWVIVGGESGAKARPMEKKWLMDIVLKCQAVNVPVFVKQLGTHQAKKMKLKHHKGGDIAEWPEGIRIREMPDLTPSTLQMEKG